MLPSVLSSQKAIDTSIRIIDAFVAMRRFIVQNAGILMRIANLERHHLEKDEITLNQHEIENPLKPPVL